MSGKGTLANFYFFIHRKRSTLLSSFLNFFCYFKANVIFFSTFPWVIRALKKVSDFLPNLKFDCHALKKNRSSFFIQGGFFRLKIWLLTAWNKSPCSNLPIFLFLINSVKWVDDMSAVSLETRPLKIVFLLPLEYPLMTLGLRSQDIFYTPYGTCVYPWYSRPFKDIFTLGPF